MSLVKLLWEDIKNGCKKFIALSPNVEEDRKIIYGFIILLIFVLFLLAHSNGNNDLTNWIIAIANIVMAGAAIVGVIYARRYVNELATKDGYKVALNLKQEIMPSLLSSPWLNTMVMNFHHSVGKCINQNDDQATSFIPRENVVSLFEQIKYIDKYSVEYEQNLSTFLSSTSMLKTCGWGVSSEKAKIYDDLYMSLLQHGLSFQYIHNTIIHKFHSYLKDKSVVRNFPLNITASELVDDHEMQVSLSIDIQASFKNLCEDFQTTNDKKECLLRQFLDGEGDLFKYFKPK